MYCTIQGIQGVYIIGGWRVENLTKLLLELMHYIMTGPCHGTYRQLRMACTIIRGGVYLSRHLIPKSPRLVMVWSHSMMGSPETGMI